MALWGVGAGECSGILYVEGFYGIRTQKQSLEEWCDGCSQVLDLVGNEMNFQNVLF